MNGMYQQFLAFASKPSWKPYSESLFVAQYRFQPLLNNLPFLKFDWPIIFPTVEMHQNQKILFLFKKMPKEVAKGKKVAANPYAKKAATKKNENPLIEKKPRNFGIGQDIQPKRNLSRFVKWPEYVRLQRQKAILKQRLKVPPAINQFSNTLDKNTGK